MLSAAMLRQPFRARFDERDALHQAKTMRNLAFDILVVKVLWLLLVVKLRLG